ncbi:MAG: GNAT family N-acetyltransferase [Pseudomonadota bacterium]
MRCSVEPLRRDHEAAWRDLWAAYLEFYETSVSEDVYATTFDRLLSPEVPEMGAFVAEVDRAPMGLVHFIFHRHCWRIEDVCYLQDLFVAPESRGTGAGRALIEAVYTEADRRGCPSVYWLTQDFNATARQLYDRVAGLTPFIKYAR